MREYVLYEVVNGKLIRETSNRWSLSRKEALELYEKNRPIVEVFMRECEYLIDSMLGQGIQLDTDYILDGKDSIIGSRIIMQVDDTVINFDDYDAETIKSTLNKGIEEAGRGLVKLGNQNNPETVSLVRGRGGAVVDDNSIKFESDSAYRIANELRGTGLLSEGVTLYVSENEAIEIDPIIDKPVVTIKDDETTISVVFHQITGGYTTKINIVSNSHGGKKLGRTTDLRIQNEHKKSLCYAMGDDAVVKLLVKTENKMSAGCQTIVGYELIRIIEIIDQKDNLKLVNHLPDMQYVLK